MGKTPPHNRALPPTPTPDPPAPPSIQEAIRQSVEEFVPDPVDRDRALKIFTAIIRRSHSGPLPSPDVLAEYDRVLPGLAERVVSMAENQSNHRIRIESTVVTSNTLESQRGQKFGFMVAIVGLGVCLTLALYGHDVVAGIVGGTTLLGLVTVFVVGKNAQRRDLEEKK